MSQNALSLKDLEREMRHLAARRAVNMRIEFQQKFKSYLTWQVFHLLDEDAEKKYPMSMFSGDNSIH